MFFLHKLLFCTSYTTVLYIYIAGTSPLAPRPVIGDCLDHSPTIARGLRRSPLNLCSGTASTTLQPQLGDFAARPSTCARGLPRPLSDHSSGTLRLNYMRLATRIQLGYSNSTSQNRPPFLPGFLEQALSPVPPNVCMGSTLYAAGDRQVPSGLICLRLRVHRLCSSHFDHKTN